MKRLLTTLALLLFGSVAFAQTPTLTFTLETSTPDGQQILPRLIWSTTPAATSCTASGASSWTGSKAASGNVQLAGVSSSQTYGLACTWPGVSVVALTWDAPTTNSDGSAYTNPGGYRVQYGTAANALNTSVSLSDPAARSWTSPNLAAGTWHFGVRTVNALGLESPPATTSKATSAAQNVSRTLELTIRFPNSPANLAAQ